MNQKEWLDWRRQGIGASDAPVIMGVSPWKTYEQLKQEKVNGGDEEENEAMKFGKESEEMARQMFEEMTGHIVFPNKRYIHKEHDWLRATLDGIDLDEKIMVEIKMANKKDHILASMQKIPPKYFPQCQHQMMVLDIPEMFYFSCHKKQGIIVKVIRDDAYISDMFFHEKIFWDTVLSMRRAKELEAML
jgi:putative phage-type endonuclease